MTTPGTSSPDGSSAEVIVLPSRRVMRYLVALQTYIAAGRDGVSGCVGRLHILIQNFVLELGSKWWANG